MKKSFTLLNEDFESSSQKTPQYLTFHRTFKREFTEFLKSLGATDIQVAKPNHFDVSGFFTAQNGQIYYFSVGDLRWSKTDMLIRTAKHYKDYTGGSNQSASLRDVETFKRDVSFTISR